MIRVTIGAMTVQADTQAELDSAVQELCLPLTEKEMAVFAGVSVRTINPELAEAYREYVRKGKDQRR